MQLSPASQISQQLDFQTASNSHTHPALEPRPLPLSSPTRLCSIQRIAPRPDRDFSDRRALHCLVQLSQHHRHFLVFCATVGTKAEDGASTTRPFTKQRNTRFLVYPPPPPRQPNNPPSSSPATTPVCPAHPSAVEARDRQPVIAVYYSLALGKPPHLLPALPSPPCSGRARFSAPPAPWPRHGYLPTRSARCRKSRFCSTISRTVSTPLSLPTMPP